MEYNDEPILSLQDYELMAREYASALHKRGFIFVQVDDEQTNAMVEEAFQVLAEIKACLFNLGGFLNTSTMYSLNERHIKKLRVIFDYDKPLATFKLRRDKTYCFLRVFNMSDKDIKLEKGLKIAQIFFEFLQEVPEITYNKNKKASFNDENKYLGYGKYDSKYKNLIG